MSDFNEEYKKLNPEQKQAVDHIDGPLLVIAGPGTGKTQLLSMRVANILRQDPSALEGNILCLTYSSSGEAAMRQRLVKLLGSSGQKVPVYTFHSFGSDIMARYPEYFYRGADFLLADELRQYELMQSIFHGFDNDHPLYGYGVHKLSQLKATLGKIHEFKKAGYTPDDIRKVLDHNELFLNFVEPLLDEAVGGQTISLALIENLRFVLGNASKYKAKALSVPFIVPISEIFVASLRSALDESTELEGRAKTKPLTAWKNQWRDSSIKNAWRCNDRANQLKLRSVVDVYESYQKLLMDQQLFDYEDMIMHTVQQLEQNAELRSQLQEQYLYILVDEYQDTNQAQLRMIRAIADHPVHEGRPNIMVVGDDDQAIYKFQGADINNLLEFERHYPKLTQVTLVENYRSHQAILDLSRTIITQADMRLEKIHPEIIKKLHSKANDLPKHATIEQPRFSDQRTQYAWVAKKILELIDSGSPASRIAVLARQHHELSSMVPHLLQAGLAIDYERREDILQSTHIVRLIKTAELTVTIAQQKWREADALFPEVLSQAHWQIPNNLIWEVALEAYQQRVSWLQILTNHADTRLQIVANVLAKAATSSLSDPLEQTLDLLLGAPGSDDQGATAPYYQYYFGDVPQEGESDYLTLLSHLITLRRKLADYKSGERLYLSDLLSFAQLHKERGLGILDTHTPIGNTDAVQVMTAHKAKGLEFDSVFILNCLEPVWGKPARSHRKLIKYPANLNVLEPAGDTLDDWIRLFFVGLTRARHGLYFTDFTSPDDGSDAMPLSYLQNSSSMEHINSSTNNDTDAKVAITNLQADWRTAHYLDARQNQERLSSTMESFRLSSTGLNDFLDLQYAGPELFVARHILRFPSAPSTATSFGDGMHAAMTEIHRQFNELGKVVDKSAVLKTFNRVLTNKRLSLSVEKDQLEKGEDRLKWLLQLSPNFIQPGQISERSFGKHPIMLGSARLTGKLDAITLTKSKATITDYKTGRPHADWDLNDNIKEARLYKYKRQLIFYKLLVENAAVPEMRGMNVSRAELIFLEPALKTGELVRLAVDISNEDTTRLSKLIAVVWDKIMKMDFPDVSAYSSDLKGIKQFEEDLINGHV